jgi:hypothetical protein
MALAAHDRTAALLLKWPVVAGERYELYLGRVVNLWLTDLEYSAVTRAFDPDPQV